MRWVSPLHTEQPTGEKQLVVLEESNYIVRKKASSTAEGIDHNKICPQKRFWPAVQCWLTVSAGQSLCRNSPANSLMTGLHNRAALLKYPYKLLCGGRAGRTVAAETGQPGLAHRGDKSVITGNTKPQFINHFLGIIIS